VYRKGGKKGKKVRIPHTSKEGPTSSAIPIASEKRKEKGRDDFSFLARKRKEGKGGVQPAKVTEEGPKKGKAPAFFGKKKEEGTAAFLLLGWHRRKGKKGVGGRLCLFEWRGGGEKKKKVLRTRRSFLLIGEGGRELG